jgi:prepilin signal peptidase PulO-like enzyme (type II secretory pathway)
MLPSPAPTQIAALVLLLAWLGACVVYDLHSRQVPGLLTIPPLVLAAFWRVLQGGWPMVLLVIALILVSDLHWAKWRIPLACLGGVLALSLAGSPESVYTSLVIFAAWAMWEIGATGGADAKIIISLVLLFGNGWLFIPIVLVGGVQGLVGLMSRKKTIPYTVAITLGTAAWLWLSAGR